MAIKRVMGTETEYGIIGGSASRVLDNYKGKSKTHENKSLSLGFGVTPTRSHGKGFYGGFSQYFCRDEMLANGARFYIDMGHPEYSTPECSNPLSAVVADKAGERILDDASNNGKIARIFKNNTDGTISYGAHENYFVDRINLQAF